MIRNHWLLQLSQRWLSPRSRARYRFMRRASGRTLRPTRLSLEKLEDRLVLSATIIDLGALPGVVTAPSSLANGINSSGQVVGVSGSSFPEVAFLYSNGQMSSLGTLPGDTYSEAYGINDSGQVVGYSEDASTGQGLPHAFLYSNGQMTDLGTLPGVNIASSEAYGINDSGQVVGVSGAPISNSIPAGDAFLSSNGHMTDMNTLIPANSGWHLQSATAINASGQIVGFGTNPNGQEDAFLYSNGQVSDLGTLPGGNESGATAINSTGQVVGYANTTSSFEHAFLYSNGQMSDLGTLPGDTYSEAEGINDSGQVVGTSESSSGSNRAFLYINGQMIDLNTLLPANSGWQLQYATAINDSDQITGDGIFNGQAGQVFRLDLNTAITFSPTNLPDAAVGTAYSQTITASGGNGTLSLTDNVPSNTLGLSFTISGSTLTINGTPTATGSIGFSVTATDTFGDTATQNYTLIVNSAVWKPIGPAPIVNGQTGGSLPVSGRVTGIAADPHNANIIYITSAGGGIWKTTDGGTTWTPLTDNLTDNSGNPLPEFMGAVAETDAGSGNQVVYAGMGEANNSGDSYYGDGILVSNDGGSTWALTNAGGAFTGHTIAKIVIDPADPTGATAYAAVDGYGTNVLGGNTGIWKTTNFGQTWTNLTGSSGLSTSAVWSDMVIDPHTPNTLYAAAEGNGVYKSTDGGTTWTLLSGIPSGTQDGRIALALYDDGFTNELIASIANPSSGQLFEMLKSLDGGDTFTVLSAPNYMGDQGWYDNTLAIDPTNPTYIYAGGAQSQQGPTFFGSPLESFDGGSTWTDIATDPAGTGPHSDDHAVAFDDNGNLIDGDDGGVFKLSNPTSQANQRWSSLNTNLQITQFEGIAVDPTNGNVWGGSQDNGTEEYTGALGWQAVPPWEGDGGITRIDPANHNIIYQEYTDVVTKSGISLRVSTNGGTTFNNVAAIPRFNSNNFYVSYVLDSSGNVYYGTDYLNFSSNQGGSWSQIGSPGVNNFNPYDSPIDAIAVNPVANSNVVYVSAGGQMFVTRNAQAGGNSVTWTEIDLPDSKVAVALNSIAVDPSDTTGGTAYAVVNAFTGGGSHVFKTTNFGATWTDISGNLPDTPVWSVAVSPDGKTVWVGTDVGVYSTSNGGISWAPFGTGMPNAQVVELEDVPSRNLLVAGTHGRGAWEISTVGASGAASPITFSPTTLSAATEGTAFNQSITASGASGTLTLTDNVPSNTLGLNFSISGSTLTISGTPTDTGNFRFSVTATDTNGDTDTQYYNLTVDSSTPTPFITLQQRNQTVTTGETAFFTAAASSNLPSTVQWQISTDAGSTWSNITGATSTTLILGSVTASMSGNEYRAVFTNSAGKVTTNPATLSVNSDLDDDSTSNITFSPSTLPATTVGTVYNETITAASDGSSNLILTDSLPSETLGLNFSINGSTLTISGTPTGDGTVDFSVTATDSNGDKATANYTLTVSQAPTTVAAGSAIAHFSSGTQSVNVVVKVSSPGGLVNSGTVTVLLNGSPVGDAAVSNDSATLSVTIPAGEGPGTYTLTEAYSGSASFLGSSAVGTLTINPLPPPPPVYKPPPLQVPPLLAMFDSLLGGVETYIPYVSETVTDSFFGIPLLVSTFDSSGHLESVLLFGIINVTFLFG